MASPTNDTGGGDDFDQPWESPDEEIDEIDDLEEVSVADDAGDFQAFVATRQEVLGLPQRLELWDKLDRLAKATDRVEEAAAAYREVLNRDLDRDLALDLIDRAVAFHDEWLDEPNAVYELLSRVLEIDPSARWAFERISLQLTVTARWDELLGLYDRTIAATKDRSGRLLLLDEAAAVAKDCAGKPERAVDYLLQIFKLRPTDAQTGGALERLLKQQKRYHELIDFWTTRLKVLVGREALATRQQIAACWLEDLNDPNGALAAVEPLLNDPLTADTACKLLEMILGSPASTPEVRSRALELLAERYDDTRRWRDVVRALEVALTHVTGDERVLVHREITRRLVEHEEHDAALQHLAALVALAQDDWDDDKLARVLSGKFDDTVAGCKPAIDAERGAKLLHLAAELSARKFKDRERAITLYLKLLSVKPDDIDAVAKLSRLYADSDRTEDLLDLRRHELELAESPDRRIALRLEISGLMRAVGDAQTAADTLRENLAERADHEPTIDALIEVLDKLERHDELAELLTSQAAEVEALDRDGLAATLWFKAARIYEEKLENLDRAVDCYQRVVELRDDTEALDALANIHTDRKEHAVAVGWLEKRLALTATGARTATVLRLARAHMGAGQSGRALACLNAGLDDDPASLDLRRLLAELHRGAQNWTELVDVLLAGAERSPDGKTKFQFLMEAAEVQQHGLRAPERAVPVLEQAAAIAPADRTVRTALADAFRAAGRLDEARNLATALIQEYGRRHPPERAKLHLLLARVLHTQGNPAEAIKQLVRAATMDMGNVGIQHMLGRVYWETGQLQNAERAYHALVLLIRRRLALSKVPIDDDDLGVAEALFELHRVSKELGADARAAENLESAFDAAAQSEREASRFERALRESGQADLLLRALERRMTATEAGPARARVLADMAAAYEPLGRLDDAFGAMLQAVQESPSEKGYVDRAQELSRRANKIDPFAEALSTLADHSLDSGDGVTGCDLLLRLALLEERDRDDLSRAAELYARAEDTGERLADVWSGMARVAAKRGEASAELDALRKIVDADADATSHEERIEVLYRLAELELSFLETLLVGLDTITQAFELDPRTEHTVELLRKAHVLDAENTAVIEKIDAIARISGDDPLLLETFEMRARLPEMAQDALQEATELAARLEDAGKQEMFLERAVEVAREEAGDVAQALWALRQLAARREEQGDMRDAVRWMREAAEVAEPDEACALSMKVASLSADALGDLELAADTYERLLELQPGEPTIWQPLVEVVRRMADDVRLERLLAATIETVYEPQLRNELRLEQAQLLQRTPDRVDDATEVLLAVLEDDPDHAQAAEILADLFERTEKVKELTELVERQLEGARERSDALAGVAFAVRLAGLAATERRDAALATFRDTLAWIPGSTQLLRGLLDLLDPERDAAERADLMEKLLQTEGLDDALALALALVDAREKLADRDGMERALDRAFAIDPKEQRVLIHLQRMAEALEDDARSVGPGDKAVELLAKAATIHGERLEDPGSAADLISKARDYRPLDIDLLDRLVRYLLRAGQQQQAVDHVSNTLDTLSDDTANRARLLRTRATIWTSANEHESAVHDLEQALVIEGDAVADELYQALVRAREAASERGDFEAERNATLRLAAVLIQIGEKERARNVAARWVADAPDDVAAIRILLEMDREGERWDDVAEGCLRLVELEAGTARADAALLLTEACERLGHPEEARASLERAYQDDPNHDLVRGKLRGLYETLHAYRELSNLLLVEANHIEDPAQKFDMLREAGRLRLSNFEQAASAIGPLSEALELQPHDLGVTLLLADAYISAGLIEEAVQLLQSAIDRQGGRRSRELAALQHRMARAAATGDRHNEMQWLNAAFESYPQGTEVASELADLATELGEYEVALKALRALSTAKTAGPISRPMAFLKQAHIARIQGDDRKAMFLAKKAVSMDADFAEGRQFLEDLGQS